MVCLPGAFAGLSQTWGGLCCNRMNDARKSWAYWTGNLSCNVLDRVPSSIQRRCAVSVNLRKKRATMPFFTLFFRQGRPRQYLIWYDTSCFVCLEFSLCKGAEICTSQRAEIKMTPILGCTPMPLHRTVRPPVNTSLLCRAHLSKIITIILVLDSSGSDSGPDPVN
jgi:hypothetical protein